jgi:hypothetical protein
LLHDICDFLLELHRHALREHLVICFLLLRVSNDPDLHHKVAGVLVESNGVHSNLVGQCQYLPVVCVFSICFVAFTPYKNVPFLNV